MRAYVAEGEATEVPPWDSKGHHRQRLHLIAKQGVPGKLFSGISFPSRLHGQHLNAELRSRSKGLENAFMDIRQKIWWVPSQRLNTPSRRCHPMTEMANQSRLFHHYWLTIKRSCRIIIITITGNDQIPRLALKPMKRLCSSV